MDEQEGEDEGDNDAAGHQGPGDLAGVGIHEEQAKAGDGEDDAADG